VQSNLGGGREACSHGKERKKEGKQAGKLSQQAILAVVASVGTMAAAVLVRSTGGMFLRRLAARRWLDTDHGSPARADPVWGTHTRRQDSRAPLSAVAAAFVNVRPSALLNSHPAAPSSSSSSSTLIASHVCSPLGLLVSPRAPPCHAHFSPLPLTTTNHHARKPATPLRRARSAPPCRWAG